MEPPSCGIGNILFYPFTLYHLLLIGLLICLLICSALISVGEASYYSLSPRDIDSFKQKGDKKSETVLRHLSNPDFLIGTIVQMNNFVSIACVLLSSYIITGLVDFSQSPVWGFVVQTVIVTFVLVLFCEVMPKLVGSQYPDRLAQNMATPLSILGKIALPGNRLMTYLSGKINKNLTPLRSVFSFEELSQAVDITGGAEVEEKKLLKSIVSFGTTDVRKIMKPRVEVSAIDMESTFDEVKEMVLESGYSRLPVYEESMDNIKGFLFIKDLLPYIHTQTLDFDWHTLIRKAYFVPENKKINDLLEEFREKKMHLAVVVDEYGGTEGVVTLEDILEEIVGEISDETDEE